MASITSNLSRKDILKHAKAHIYSLGVNDGTSSLCKANFTYGLAKLHFSQEKLGLKPNATFISTPDETISRNATRWASGYGYGGKVTWSRKNDPLIFIDLKPNVCGMLVGGLKKLPEPEEIIKNINKVLISDNYIDDIKLEWDYKKSNHFIDVFETKISKNSKAKLPPYTFIIHGSLPELRDSSDKGPGLYYDKSKVLMDMCKVIETPFGKTYYLDGDNAKEFFRFYKYAEKLAEQKRELAAKQLFGKFKVISNNVHQGLLSMGEMVLGAQSVTDNPNNLYPIALRSDLPAYLYSGLKNITEEHINDLGFEKRAKKNDVYNDLLNFNVLPHGAGYKFPHISCVKDVLEIDGDRYFICEQEMEDEGTYIFSDVSATQFLYRGKKIIRKINEVELGKMEAKLVPKYVLKI